MLAALVGPAAGAGTEGGRRGRAIAAVLAVLVLAGCATAPRYRGAGGRIPVVAVENFWGSLAAQLGGDRVAVTSMIDKPDVDPHDYEPTAADARLMATARLVVINGVGYDAWASRLVGAAPSAGRVVLTVGDLVRVPSGGNPHRWYDPGDVRAVLDSITADYQRIDPGNAAYFARLHDTVVTGAMKGYFDQVATVRARYAGTPVGASESIFSLLAPALGLTVLTPTTFLAAVSEGTEPSARDKSAIDAQIRGRRIKVYVYNSQNATPDVQAQVAAARAAGIPVTTITETLTPVGASFQDWQCAQLTALAQALAQATGE